jgi:hypothetical protein
MHVSDEKNDFPYRDCVNYGSGVTPLKHFKKWIKNQTNYNNRERVLYTVISLL